MTWNRPILAALSGLLLTACGAPVLAQQPGEILHYVRSNRDGSMREAVSVWRREPDRVEVFKRISPCTDAALVTAELDPATGQAQRLVGGRLGRDGAQEPFAWLEHDAANDRLLVRLGASDAAPSETLTLQGDLPWRLYDFDFADWNGLAEGPPPERLAFELILAWPEGDTLLTNLGAAEAVYIADEARLNRPARRYSVAGPGFSGGDLWLDAETGQVLEVAWGQPNHPGYDDFRLVLTGRGQGEAAWRTLLAAHWADCPAA